MDPFYHRGIPIWERRLTHPHMEMVNQRFHRGIEKTIQSLTHFHNVFVTIWEFRKKSPYGNLIINHLVSPFPYYGGRETKNLHLGTPHNHKVFVTYISAKMCNLPVLEMALPFPVLAPISSTILFWIFDPFIVVLFG